MLEQQPCADFLIVIGKQLWMYLVSDEGHIVFGIVATARGIIYYLKRTNTPESTELANTVWVALFLGLILVATERLAPSVHHEASICREHPSKMSKIQPSNLP